MDRGWHGGCISGRQDRKLASISSQTETSLYRASADADYPAQTDWEMKMNTRQNQKSVTSIEQQLSTIQLTSRQRDEVLHSVVVAGLIANAIVWACNRVQRVKMSVGGFAKPSPKY